MLSYHNFPLIKFCRVLQDYKLLKEYGIKEEDWEAIVKEYQEINIDPETSVLLEASRRVLLEGLKLNKMVALLTYIITVDADWKPFFEAAGLKYQGDQLKDSKYLTKEINKAKQKEAIYNARLKDFEKKIEESKKTKKELNISDVYKNIGSFEIHGFNIPDYELLTCGKYNAMMQIIKEKAKKRG